MKRFTGLLIAVTLMVLCTAPALAAGLTISPPTVEFDVPADASSRVEFLVYDFTGDLQISLEDIPLRVEPTIAPVTAKKEGTRVVLTFYGDESLGSKIYQGKIRFLAMTGGTVAFGIKVRATVNHIAASEPLPQPPPEESPPAPAGESVPKQAPPASTSPPEQAPPAKAPSPEPTPTTAELPILPLAGIAAGTLILMTLVVVLARRPRRY